MSPLVSDPVRLPHPLAGSLRVIRDAKRTVLLVFPADGTAALKFVPATDAKPRPRKPARR